jgi:hypothetical protein
MRGNLAPAAGTPSREMIRFSARQRRRSRGNWLPRCAAGFPCSYDRLTRSFDQLF